MAEENNNEENIPQPKPFPPEMVQDPESKTVAHQVRDYLWGKGPIDYQLVSAHLTRDSVSRFVAFEMRELPPQYFWRVRILADLYNLKEHLDFIQSFLTKQENEPEELDRSIANTIILEEIGAPPQQTLAAQYFEYLVSHRLSNRKFAELIDCLAVLGNRANPGPLRLRMEQEIKALSAREGTDPEAEIEKRVIEELLDNEFFFIEEANESRLRIQKLSDPDQYLLEIIRVYLQLTEDGGASHFDLWIQQQIRRTAEAKGSQKVIESFRSVLSTLTEMGSRDEIFCRIRCYNAIEFFLGKLNPDEEAFMQKYRQRQIDPLRYMPVPHHIDDVEDLEEEEDLEDEEVMENEDEK
jgi:hypothetical protein